MAITKVTTAVTDFNSATESGLKLPSGTNGNRPTGVQGMLRNDTDEDGDAGALSALEHYNGTAWKTFIASASPDVIPLVVNYLVVAGGGAGQGRRGGGGGAGGLIATTAYGGSNNAITISPSNYTFAVSVGSGAIGVQGSTQSFAATGNNSTIAPAGSSLLTYGGGGGGASVLQGRPGGSGGGGGNGGGSYNNQGGGILDLNAECSPGGRSPTFQDAGGGGGATGPNPAGLFNLGASGLVSNITGASATYAVGGRGGYVGQGSGNGIPAANNTGSGGSGMYDGYLVGGNTAGSGGHGIIIFRYSNDYTASSTLTFTESPLSGTTDRVIIITGVGSGTITFSLTP